MPFSDGGLRRDETFMKARRAAASKDAKPVAKTSYVIPCASSFRDAVQALAHQRGVNAGDLARSVMLTLPAGVVAGFPDPGGPGLDDRETVVLKSGAQAGKPWRRKPRLQVRLPAGQNMPMIRRALGIALALERGEVAVTLEEGKGPTLADRLKDRDRTIDRLRSVVSTLAFTPLSDGVRNRADALHVLGFAPDSHPDARAVNARFRLLATVHHPDSEIGDHERMTQLTQAVRTLRPGRG